MIPLIPVAEKPIGVMPRSQTKEHTRLADLAAFAGQSNFVAKAFGFQNFFK